MERDLLTTREVAKLLGVGTTSIKRWADSGLLRCVKTPGGHRRFPRDGVDAFLERGQSEPSYGGARVSPQNRTESWLRRLKDGISTNDIVKSLHAEWRGHGSWYEVADSMSLVLEEIGRAWARGDLSVIQEHIISERLMRAIARIVESDLPTDGTRTCMLMAAEGDDHTLGLSLVELCLREVGWSTTWVGRKTPVHIACEYILGQDIQMVAVSASEYSRDSAALADQANRLAHACRTKGVPLMLGGMGLWPGDLEGTTRIFTFTQLHDALVKRNNIH